jgi:heavy metal translocating P-type ATPase
MRATHVGTESTIERMAQLIREAQLNKSRPERLADRFAAAFLPILLVLGAVVYIKTHNIGMTAALFLVACADDMALAIPLAMTAAIGRAARRGVIVKGGSSLDILSRIKSVVLDKTGTLTYGAFQIHKVWIDPAFTEYAFWRAVGVASKFSEHPISHALLTEAYKHVKAIPDPNLTDQVKGQGVIVHHGEDIIAIGNGDIITTAGATMRPSVKKAYETAREDGTAVVVLINGVLAGTVTISDAPRTEAAPSLVELSRLGINNVVMYTGDNEVAAKRIGKALGIKKIKAEMKPEDKLKSLERIRERPVAMVGDGINDAPALARADVGIAMGRGGTAIASEAADVVVLTDNLSRLPEMISLSRKTMSVIRWDIVIWTVSNLFGFWLVLSGFAGPAIASFYNFATDFLPLLNSVRLFRAPAKERA